MVALSTDVEGSHNDVESGPTEVSPLITSNNNENQNSTSDVSQGEDVWKSRRVAGMLSLLLIGTFIGNADGSIVMATNGTISSYFSQLENAAWLMTSYTLTMGAAQPVLGKLSDIFGRKGVLLACYAIFGFGTIICGIGQTMWQVILGRAVAGIGGAGMGVIVSILITDLVPKADIAVWRSYANVVGTTGRSLGGPIGGWLADSVGWRWSFLGQGPIFVLAFILVLWKLDIPSSCKPVEAKTSSKLGRIDFFGAILISGTIVIFILALELPNRGFSWSSPTVVSMFVASVLLGTMFCWWEASYAREPIFPPKLLLKRDVATSYSITALQTAAQVSMMFTVPLYFQVTQGASNARAGSHLVPAVLGNTIGGLLTGYYIKRTGHYRVVTILAAISTMLAYTLLIFRWHGHTNIFESLEIFPGGFGSGMAGASAFVALTSKMQHKDMAVATSGFYLASCIGLVLGVNASSSIQKIVLKAQLIERLTGPGSTKIIRKVLSDVLYVNKLEGTVKETVLQSYITSLEYSHGFSFICSGVALFISFFVQEHSLVN